MTKYARLADGSSMPFPDEMPDEQMHREVKKKLGIEVLPTPEETMRSEDMQMSGARNEALALLGQQVQTLSQVVYKLCEDQKVTQRLLSQVVGAIGRLDQSVVTAAQQITDAVMAPSRQEVERGDDGKIAATNIFKRTDA